MKRWRRGESIEVLKNLEVKAGTEKKGGILNWFFFSITFNGM